MHRYKLQINHSNESHQICTCYFKRSYLKEFCDTVPYNYWCDPTIRKVIKEELFFLCGSQLASLRSIEDQIVLKYIPEIKSGPVDKKCLDSERTVLIARRFAQNLFDFIDLQVEDSFCDVFHAWKQSLESENVLENLFEESSEKQIKHWERLANLQDQYILESRRFIVLNRFSALRHTEEVFGFWI